MICGHTRRRIIRRIKESVMDKDFLDGNRYKIACLQKEPMGMWFVQDVWAGKRYIVKYNGSWEVEECDCPRR